MTGLQGLDLAASLVDVGLAVKKSSPDSRTEDAIDMPLNGLILIPQATFWQGAGRRMGTGSSFRGRVHQAIDRIPTASSPLHLHHWVPRLSRAYTSSHTPSQAAPEVCCIQSLHPSS